MEKTVLPVACTDHQITTLFIDKFNKTLSLISKDNKLCCVMGGFNLHLLQYNYHVPTQDFIDSLFWHSFLPLISKPTRLISYSNTLLDNAFTKNLVHNNLSGIVPNDLSDHLPVYFIF